MDRPGRFKDITYAAVGGRELDRTGVRGIRTQFSNVQDWGTGVCH
jgi:hypothetical protein